LCAQPCCRWDALQRLGTSLLLKLFYAADEAGSADDATLAAAASEAEDDGGSEQEISSLNALATALEAVLDDGMLDGQYKVCDTKTAEGAMRGWVRSF
jgi:hypothetical protein